MYAEILIEYPTKKIDKYFTYKIPLALKDIINIGMKVKVPFGTKIINGFVMNILNDFDNEYELKEIVDVIDKELVLNDELMGLGKYIQEKTLCPLISSYQTMLPGSLKIKNNDTNYNFYKTFNITEQEEDDFWNANIESYGTNQKSRPFASEVINKLKSKGYEIYIITARWLSNREDEVGKRMRDIVKKWLNENDIYYDKLIFSKDSKERKIREIIDNKIDIMIEDSPNNIMELSSLIPVICYDCNYNKNIKGKNIIRCYSWYDIYKKIGCEDNEIE